MPPSGVRSRPRRTPRPIALPSAWPAITSAIAARIATPPRRNGTGTHVATVGASRYAATTPPMTPATTKTVRERPFRTP